MGVAEPLGLAAFAVIVLFVIALFVVTSQPFVDHLTRWWVRRKRG